MFFTIYWLGGSFNFIEGNTIEDAFTKAGYGAGAVSAIDWYDNNISQTHKYDFKLKKWIPSDKPDYVMFGDVCHHFMGKQTQYGVRFLSEEVAADCHLPYLGKDIRLLGDTADYHSLMIHKEDVPVLIERFRAL